MLQAEGNEYQALLDTANLLCRQFKGEEVALRGLVPIGDDSQPEAALEKAISAGSFGCSSVLIQQDGPCEEVEQVSTLIREIRAQSDLRIALCMGERAYEVYATWRQEGAEEYILPHECCNPRLYGQLYPGRSPAERLTRYLWLHGLGFQVTGGIRLGLAGQTQEELADELEVLRNAELTGVILRPMTADCDLLRVLAITRLCLPEADLMVAIDDPALQAKALTCGANMLTAGYGENHPDLSSIYSVLAPTL